MFELPDAKRVRRQDLLRDHDERDSSPDEAEVAENQARLQARLSSLLSLDFGSIAMSAAPTAAPPPPAALQDEEAEADGSDTAGAAQEEEAAEEAAEEEFEFRLFSTSSASQKVVLAPDEEAAGAAGYEGGSFVSRRPLSFYLRGELSAEEKAKIEFAAVSGGDVISMARQRAWGLEVPWRVTKITVSSSSPGRKEGDSGESKSREESGKDNGALEGGGTEKRKRPGKKRRIVLRTRQKAEKELERVKMTKEEHLKEKKKRLNREKKLKRRQKEKEKKLAGGVVEAGRGVMGG